ncbi:MAG: ureidoglycolate lyase [Hansschlegelia sp.]
MTKPLVPEPLTKAAFAPFGEVIETEGAEVRIINQGFAKRFHALARAEVGGAQAIISIFRATRRPSPIRIDMLERHPLGSQAFAPIQPHDWLIVVADDAGAQPDLATLRCFRARGDQGVNYASGVWHFPVLILADAQDFLIVDREGPGENLHEFFFPEDAVTAIAL